MIMKRQFAFRLLIGVLAMLGLAACTDSDNFETESGNDSHVYNISVTVNDNADSPQSRVLSLNEDNVVLSNWVQGDKILVFNCSDKDASRETDYSKVTANDANTHKTAFTGAIKSRGKMTTNDYLAFFYPGTPTLATDKANVKAAEKNDEKITYDTVDKNGKEITKDTIVTSYIDSEKIKKQIKLDLSHQDGQLATIDANYDYNWGTVKPTEVNNDGTVKATVNLKRLVSFWGLKFKDENGNPINNIKTIYINGVKSSDVLDLTNGTYLGGAQNKDYAIDVKGNGTTGIQAQNGYVWVALFPDVSDKISFTLITTDDQVYSKDVHKVFAVNKTYRSTVKLEKLPKAKPYVKVAGTLWATGNFIHYTNGTEEYWGIAPAQWWISNYADNPTQADRMYLYSIYYNVLSEQPGSQHWYFNNKEGGFGMTAEDCDLFTQGLINNPFDFTAKKYLSWNPLIRPDIKDPFEGKWFDKDKRLTTDRTKAYYGDIVYLYTTETNYNHQYRYPKMEELKGLWKNAKTVIPGYCYTDKGNKIYGAYFSDQETGGISAKNYSGFPVGTKSLWKFEDVTGLVLTNKGLFLPFAGFMFGVVNSNRVNYRLVDYGQIFTGHYWSSQSSSFSTGTLLVFGSGEGSYAAAPKPQGSSIRPVYVGTEGDEASKKPLDASKYNMFRGIVDENGVRKY